MVAKKTTTVNVVKANKPFESGRVKLPDGGYANPGFYLIKMHSTDRIYVGSSTAVDRRVTKHLSTLRNGKHEYKEIQDAYKVGEPMSIIVAYTPNHEVALNNEQLVLDSGGCLNKSDDARNSFSDRILSQETKDKIGLAHRGKFVSEKTRKKLSESHKGQKVVHSEETCKKISDNKKGKTMSDSHYAAYMAKVEEVLCRPVEVDGVRYRSLSDAGTAVGVTDTTIRNRILRNNDLLKIVIRREKEIQVGELTITENWVLFVNNEYLDHDGSRHDLAERHKLEIVYPQIDEVNQECM